MNSPETYTPRKLAKEMGLPYRAILRAIADGHLQCMKLNKRVFRIHSKSVASWHAKLIGRHNLTQADTTSGL